MCCIYAVEQNKVFLIKAVTDGMAPYTKQMTYYTVYEAKLPITAGKMQEKPLLVPGVYKREMLLDTLSIRLH